MQGNVCENKSNLMDCEIPKLLLATKNFKGQRLVEWNAVESKTDFGFMSSIYEAKLITGDDGKL